MDVCDNHIFIRQCAGSGLRYIAICASLAIMSFKGIPALLRRSSNAIAKLFKI